MERRSRKRTGTSSGDNIIKYARFLAVPVIVLLLLAVIVIAGKGSALKKEKQDSHVDETSAEITSLAETDVSFELSGYHLGKDEMPELTALVQTYCQAKTDSDPEILDRVFGGRGLSSEELESEKQQMEHVSQIVEGYGNIACYSVSGLEPDTYVIYPYFEIKYKGAEALVPSLSWAYVKKDAEGQFYIIKEISEAETEHIRKVSVLEDVKNLSAQVEAQKAEAIAGDARLQEIYQGVSEPGEETGTVEETTVLEETTAQAETQPEP